MSANIGSSEGSNLTPSTGKKANVGKIFDKVWEVFKGLFIAAIILAVIFNTFVSIFYLIERQVPVPLSPFSDYPYNTQDALNLTEAYSKDPNSAEYKQMLREFNIKYSIPYKQSGTYMELARLHKENPYSEEYNQTLAELLEQFDISVEDITFDE